jgi:hypothetical protein
VKQEKVENSLLKYLFILREENAIYMNMNKIIPEIPVQDF